MPAGALRPPQATDPGTLGGLMPKAPEPPVARTEHAAEREEPKLPPSRTEAEAIAMVNGALQDVYFSYDRSVLSEASLATLRRRMLSRYRNVAL